MRFFSIRLQSLNAIDSLAARMIRQRGRSKNLGKVKWTVCGYIRPMGIFQHGALFL
jgi:hypothetical protein